MAKHPLNRDALVVHSNGDRVGALLEHSNIWEFNYAPDWLARPDAFALAPSLSL